MMYSDKPRREIYRFKFSRTDTTVDLPFIINIGHEQKAIIAKLSLCADCYFQVMFSNCLQVRRVKCTLSFSLFVFSLAVAPQQTTAVTSDGDSAVPSTAPDSEQPGTSGEASALTIDGIPIPDGVDPSFLEALPEAIRREVLAEQLGLHPPSSSQRIVATNDNEGATDMNVSPEFLAALPPEVQEEVCFNFFTTRQNTFYRFL